MTFLVRMLETRLVEVLRFKRGQVYGVQVAPDFSLAPPQPGIVRQGTLKVCFECDPAESDELIEATLEEIKKLCSGEHAFTEDNVKAALEQDRREFEEMTCKNSWWVDTLSDLYFSRAHAVTEEIGATMALWWRVRRGVAEGFDVTAAGAALKDFFPEGSSSAVITMRPKQSWWGFLKASMARLFRGRSSAPE